MIFQAFESTSPKLSCNSNVYAIVLFPLMVPGFVVTYRPPIDPEPPSQSGWLPLEQICRVGGPNRCHQIFVVTL
jgi:hypothetical protein